MKNTTIEWTDHTLNFWWGCTKVSPACQHCYAEQVAKIFGRRIFGSVPEWGPGKPRQQRLEKARQEALALNRQAEKSGTRPRVFVNSMSDWLDDEVPIEWLAYLLETIALCPNLDFQLLTKRPENWRPRITQVSGCYDLNTDAGRKAWAYSAEWYVAEKAPPNIWIGTTVEDQQRANERIPQLLRIPAKIRFLSCEPLLGSVVLLPRELIGPLEPREAPSLTEPRIHWVICGGESGSKARPMHPDWARILRDQCQAAGVPFFFKQWGEWSPCPIGDGPDLVTDTVFKKGPSHDGQVWRIGKTTAGRLLDGREWNELPTP
jgi:protein gp37